MNGLKLYFKYLGILLKSTMQYKASFFLSCLGQFLLTCNSAAALYFLFARFQSIKGFSFAEVVFCYSIMQLSFAITESYARGFDSFSTLIITGDFDRLLLRPRNLPLQVLGSKFEFSRIGRLLIAVVLFFYGIRFGNMDWSFLKVLTVFFMLLGGIAVFSGLFLIYAAISFFTIQSLEFMNIFTDGARTFASYPVSIYGNKILRFCTFIIPYALFQYYPLLFLFDKYKNPALAFLPLLSFLFLIPAYLFWRLGVSKYKSTGS